LRCASVREIFIQDMLAIGNKNLER